MKLSLIMAMETMGKRANTSSVIHDAIANLPSVFGYAVSASSINLGLSTE